MHFRMTARLGMAMAALAATAVTAAAAKPAAKPAAKAPAKSAAKTAVKPPKAVALGKTPHETVAILIAAMKKQDRDSIGGVFDWTRFAAEMNKLIPGEKGLDAKTYKTLLVETLSVPDDVSKALRVGKETMKGAGMATVSMERLFAADPKAKKPAGYREINILSLYKGKTGWKIYRLDSASQPPIAPPAPTPPPVPHVPQGMVPSAPTPPPH